VIDGVRVDAAVAAAFPDYRALALVVRGCANGPSDERTGALLAAAAERARADLAGGPPSALPRIAAWRAAFSAFGAKPSRFPSSAEALLKRVARGDDAPAVNRLVDCYNAVSIAHALPLGGEDAARIEGEAVLRHARGDEPCDVPGSDGTPQPPAPGEVVWCDALGVTCRAWNWRQGARTRITEATTDAWFLLEAMEPTGAAALELAAEELVANLAAVGAGGAPDPIRRLP
jgi:DNA/RNA-binding domain of Phe-tRNA-synthetase-like protein